MRITFICLALSVFIFGCRPGEKEVDLAEVLKELDQQYLEDRFAGVYKHEAFFEGDRMRFEKPLGKGQPGSEKSEALLMKIDWDLMGERVESAGMGIDAYRKNYGLSGKLNWLIAFYHLQKGDLESAEAMLPSIDAEARDSDRFRHSSNWLAALIYERRKQADKAMLFHQMNANTVPEEREADYYTESLIRIGHLYTEQEEFDEALNAYSKCLEASREYNVQRHEAWSQFHIGKTHMARGNDDAASAAFEAGKTASLALGEYGKKIISFIDEALSSEGSE